MTIRKLDEKIKDLTGAGFKRIARNYLFYIVIPGVIVIIGIMIWFLSTMPKI